ncbi:MAG: hypothetical protein JWM56_257 [Candidatus Peribacteria bacterium]|nr:hypothetical protein [Candidatus Peribacteria bacterium]
MPKKLQSTTPKKITAPKKPVVKKSSAVKKTAGKEKKKAGTKSISTPAENKPAASRSPSPDFFPAQKGGLTTYSHKELHTLPPAQDTLHANPPSFSPASVPQWVAPSVADASPVKATASGSFFQLKNDEGLPALFRTLLMTGGAMILIGGISTGGYLGVRYFFGNKAAVVATKVKTPELDTFEECAAAGYYVNDGSPRICQTPDGKVYEEDTMTDAALEAQDLVLYIQNPVEGEAIANPFTLTGRARIYDNPVRVRILDADGTELALQDFFVPLPKKGNYGTISLPIPYTAAKGKQGTVEIFEYLAPGKRGQERHIPIRFKT